jgi:hypothetical protein
MVPVLFAIELWNGKMIGSFQNAVGGSIQKGSQRKYMRGLSKAGASNVGASNVRAALA